MVTPLVVEMNGQRVGYLRKQAIRERIQRRFQTATNQPFDLLSRIRANCIGAIKLYLQNDSDYLDSLNLLHVKQVNAKPLNHDKIAQLFITKLQITSKRL